ncbi:putative porin [Alcaligenes endophyticus]|uniref:Porin n=1 Tax=Alcaligenes endophyticus TaxID=1929088 RepID=A0ABT8EIF6_9BURK|nr:putative porin [Alcaligenes endophyticus]MCX5592586.1 putative porin [Alcaligenes endophyticus]MDN4121066.1 putative porin [Alcaligenes endophyticus]
MKYQPHRLSLALAACLMCSSALVAAQPVASDNATANLIRLLVEQGVLQPEQAASLLKQAQDEASSATKGSVAQPGDVRVPYIPVTVRDQIREEVKAEVMATAKQENWAAPNTFPDWVSRITVDGDVRVRWENRGFSSKNSPYIVDVAKLNQSSPFLFGVYDANGNQTGNVSVPLLNTRKDRNNQYRFRARIGFTANISDQWSAGIRLASGSNKSPVSTSDNFGGGFSKKSFWLDQAYLRWSPTDWAQLTAGRADNPFVSTDILFSKDLNLDGFSAAFKRPLNNTDITLRSTLGAYLIDNTYNSGMSSVADSEGETKTKWLLGAQVGADWKINHEQTLSADLAYYTYRNIAGVLSEPCDYLDTSCSTDWSSPSFIQKGNSLFLIRDVIPPIYQAGSTYQMLGLASRFNLLDLNLGWKGRVGNGLGLQVSGNYIRNLAYSKNSIEDRVRHSELVTNIENGHFRSGGNAWTIHTALGKDYRVRDRGDWQVFAGYKYIQPDAVPDAYNDSTFHMGGTNAKGYYLGGAYAIEKDVVAQLRWMSSREIYGSPLSINIMQLELNARF